MPDLVDQRPQTADCLRGLVNIQGATEITLTLTATAALRLADDLDWSAKSTDPVRRAWSATSITGAIKRDDKPVWSGSR